MMKKLRLILSTIFFLLITLLFLDFTGTLHQWFGFLAKIQFVPAILALNVLVIALLVLLTFVCGRIYCSVICPLGVYQDLVASISRGKKKFYKYSKPKTVLRVIVFSIFFVSIAVGINQVVALLDPYSIYGRFANNLLQPIWIWGNNILAGYAERADSYAFYEIETIAKGLPIIIIAVVSIVAISILAARGGRTYCNTICPVGTLLGFVSSKALYRISIDSQRCNKCAKCSKACKSSCIDLKNQIIDNSRCVTCFNCIEKCEMDAIGYKYAYGKQVAPSPEPSSDNTNSRRAFLATGAILATSAIKAQTTDSLLTNIKMDGGLAEILPRATRQRETPITPAGSLNDRNMRRKCTACQLCISVCPNRVLRPSQSLENFMQPVMSFEEGYCRPECTKCSEVCPSGAINAITKEDKSSTQIGQAKVRHGRCIPVVDKQECGNCARHCPTGAITMRAKKGTNSLPKPIINSEKCIGCGACEYVCPARPVSAIWVEGVKMHKTV